VGAGHGQDTVGHWRNLRQARAVKDSKGQRHITNYAKTQCHKQVGRAGPKQAENGCREGTVGHQPAAARGHQSTEGDVAVPRETGAPGATAVHEQESKREPREAAQQRRRRRHGQKEASVGMGEEYAKPGDGNWALGILKTMGRGGKGPC